MNTRPILASLAAATALSSIPQATAATTTIVLENDNLRAEIVPAWAGRLMSFGRKGGENVLWTQPEAADFGCYPSGTPMWKNVGGEKTWVGSQGAGWRAFAGIETGSAWPPPAWFDSIPMNVVESSPNHLVLRTAAHPGIRGWVVAMEREFTLEADVLVIRQRLIPEAIGDDGPAVLPDDDRRLWSVAQVPRPAFVMMRLIGECRHVKFGPLPAPDPDGVPGWSRLVISNSDKPGKICLDGDALAMPLADGGWFFIEQTAPERFLTSFAEPGRAMVYTSPDDFKPSVYAELEFAAYGPEAEQTLRLSFPRELP
ncbi:MAG: hypothetical protein IKO40_05415 [Kiritimatiellae bacterium]|nr:hypothetical protein [Kiritimatiellia bacterium]